MDQYCLEDTFELINGLYLEDLYGSCRQTLGSGTYGVVKRYSDCADAAGVAIKFQSLFHEDGEINETLMATPAASAQSEYLLTTP